MANLTPWMYTFGAMLIVAGGFAIWSRQVVLRFGRSLSGDGAVAYGIGSIAAGILLIALAYSGNQAAKSAFCFVVSSNSAAHGC